MAPKMLYYLLAVASAITSASAVAIAIPEAAPAPFVIPEDVEVLDLRTDSDKALVRLIFQYLFSSLCENFPSLGRSKHVISWTNWILNQGKRVNGGVYICKAINFDANQGCVLIVTSWGNPTSLVGTEWNNAISSAGADPGTNCQFFE